MPNLPSHISLGGANGYGVVLESYLEHLELGPSFFYHTINHRIGSGYSRHLSRQLILLSYSMV